MSLSDYTKTGLLLLMIGVAINICASIIAFSLYSTIDISNLETRLPSLMIVLFPIGAIGVLAGLMIILGGLFMFLGRKEFGEKHKKNIFICVIILIVTVGVVLIISVMNIFTMFSSMFSTGSLETPTITTEYLKTQLTISVIQTFVIAVLSGLIWVLGLYQLEDKKGRSLLIAAFVFMVLSPVVYSMGSYMKLTEWTTNGTFDNLLNTTTPIYSQIISLWQWTGLTGIFMLIVSLVSSILLFLALREAQQNIKTLGTSPPIPESTPKI